MEWNQLICNHNIWILSFTIFTLLSIVPLSKRKDTSFYKRIEGEDEKGENEETKESFDDQQQEHELFPFILCSLIPYSSFTLISTFFLTLHLFFLPASSSQHYDKFTSFKCNFYSSFFVFTPSNHTSQVMLFSSFSWHSQVNCTSSHIWNIFKLHLIRSIQSF